MLLRHLNFQQRIDTVESRKREHRYFDANVVEIHRIDVDGLIRAEHSTRRFFRQIEPNYFQREKEHFGTHGDCIQ